jgi:hypothetical protein
MAGFTGRASAPPMKSLPTGVESSRIALVVNVGVSMFYSSKLLMGVRQAGVVGVSTSRPGYRTASRAYP